MNQLDFVALRSDDEQRAHVRKYFSERLVELYSQVVLMGDRNFPEKSAVLGAFEDLDVQLNRLLERIFEERTIEK